MVGVDISDRSIKVVEASSDEAPKLETVGWTSLKPDLFKRGIIQDVPAVTDALREAMRSTSPHPVRGVDVVGSIPEVQSFVHVLEIPSMALKEMDEAVRWAVRRHIPFDLDRVYMDWEPVGRIVKQGKQVKQQQVLVGAAQRDVVDPLLAVLDGLDLNVVALELEALSLARCLLPRDINQATDIRGVLVIDLGATSTNALLFDQGAMRFTTSISSGGDDLTAKISTHLNVSTEVAGKLKAGTVQTSSPTDAAEAIKQATFDLVKKIEQAVREMTVQLPPEQRVQVIVLSGGSANLAGIIEVFTAVFPGIPVQLGNPWTNLNQRGVAGGVQLSTGDALHFTTAIGLALRESEYV